MNNRVRAQIKAVVLRDGAKGFIQNVAECVSMHVQSHWTAFHEMYPEPAWRYKTAREAVLYGVRSGILGV